MTEKVVELIESSPEWSEIPADDEASRSKIIEKMRGVAKYDLDTIRSAIEQYLSKKEQSEGGNDVASMSRLYVLNRYLFDVPDKVPMGERRFGSFFGIPHDSQSVNEMWPLSVDDKGKLALTGSFKGYFGEEYLPLQEFDYFKEKYGPRKIQSA